MSGHAENGIPRYFNMHSLIILVAVITIAAVDGQAICGMNATAVKLYRKQALWKHNGIRANHGMPPLKLDNTIINFAQAWADHLVANNKLEHRPLSGEWTQQYGENIFGSYTWDWNSTLAVPKGNEFVKGLYNQEMRMWKWGSESLISGADHFTQIVWKNSCKLGVGIAFSNDCSMRAVVYNFDPAGNVEGEYSENVRPRGSSAVSNSCSNK